MPPNKPHSYFDLDNGRQIIQQLSPRNDVQCGDYYIQSHNLQSPSTQSDYSSDLETVSIIPGNPYGYKSSSCSSWESSEMLHREYHHSNLDYSHAPLSMCMNSEELVNLRMCHTEACLILRTPPEHRFRYRYDTEMSGTHGSLQGMKSGSEKSVPEVELVNYSDEALIRVSLVTCNDIGERYPHPHNLFIKEKMYQKKMYENIHSKFLTRTGHYSDPHYIRVGVNGSDYLAKFEGMCIISSKKENFSASIEEKLQLRSLEQGIKPALKVDFSKKVEDAVKLVDLDFVSLCFEAFREEDGRLVPICPPLYSEPIGNAKSANTGKLKISRINKCSGSCRGGDEIWMLVEKINKKGLLIRFYEECDGKVVWESFLEGDDIILHHQYAIIFKTPPYRDPSITSEVKVLMRLERSSTQLSQTCDFSEPITFVYEPHKNRNYKCDNLFKKETILSPPKQALLVKRPRIDSTSQSSLNYQHKRKRDEPECGNMYFEEATISDLDHIFSDNGIDSAELTQFWSRFNVEDLLQFFSDDIDMPLQKDGVPSTIRSRRDLVQILHLIYSKLDENEIKKLTDQISNMRFTKGKAKLEDEEKKDVEDAVTTLLSLRERAVEINNRKKEADKNDCATLHEAVLQDKPDAVKRILYSGYGLSQDDDQNTPLHLSLLLRHDNCTENLLKFRREMCTNINLKNKEGKTPLHIAAANGNLRHVKLLLECGANVNETETKTKRNALHIAVVEKNREVAEYLLENTEIDVDALDADGKSPSAIAHLLMPPENSLIEKLFVRKEPKMERSGDCRELKYTSDVDLDKLFEALNETGSWRILAEMWNCPYLISSAEEANNPAKCIFNCCEQVNGDIELEGLRELLDAINEKRALLVLDEILASNFV